MKQGQGMARVSGVLTKKSIEFTRAAKSTKPTPTCFKSSLSIPLPPEGRHNLLLPSNLLPKPDSPRNPGKHEAQPMEPTSSAKLPASHGRQEVNPHRGSDGSESSLPPSDSLSSLGS